MSSQIDNSELYSLFKLNPIEDLIENIDIEKVKDHNIKVILRTIKYSISALHQELSTEMKEHK